MSSSTWSALPRRSARIASASLKGERAAPTNSWPDRFTTARRLPARSTTGGPLAVALDGGVAAARAAFRVVRRPYDALFAVEELVDLTVAVGVVAERDRV